VLDGNIKFFAPQLHKFGLVDTRQWLNDLRSAQSIPISENGVEYLRYCLLESAEFSLRVKAGPDGDLLEPEEADLRGWKRLRLDRNGEHLRQALHVALHLVPFSPLLIREIGEQIPCLWQAMRSILEFWNYYVLLNYKHYLSNLHSENALPWQFALIFAYICIHDYC
jgi:hypothetical protein